MKTIKLILIITFAVIFQSCDKFLDIKPKGIQIPEYCDDFARLLNHKNVMYSDNSYVCFITDDIQLGGGSLQYGQFELAHENEKNLYSFENGPIFSSGTSDNLWEKAYNRIYTFNIVADNILKCTDGTEADKQRIAAEAKIGRAFDYLLLVNTYAKEYNATSSKTDLGVPIILTVDINSKYTRNTVQEVYDQIFKDMNEALPYLSEVSSHPFRPTKQIGNAIMARIYLYMGDYDKAKTYAEAALKYKSTLTDMKLYSINPKANGSGRIFDAATKVVYPEAKDNTESIYARYGDGTLALSRNIYASEDLLNVYKQNLPNGAVDQRRALFFSDNSFTLYNVKSNFPGKSMWVPYLQFNFGFSTPELYLIAAECHARLHNPDKAIEYLDILRENRILNNVKLPKVSEQEALKIVLDERRREFAFCGSLRLIDLKRLNHETAFKKDIVHTDGTNTWTLPANDPRYILPLPPKVISQNPSIPLLKR